MTRDLTSIIVISRTRECVFDCIESIVAYTHQEETPYELIVVDSSDPLGTIREGLHDLMSQRVIHTLVGLPYEGSSYSKSMNAGIAEAKGAWITAPGIANDIVVTDQWLAAVHRAILEFSAKADGTRVQWALWPTRDGATLQPEGFGGYLFDLSRYAREETEDPDYTGYGIVHRRLLEAIGGFDERFFPCFLEDMDFGIRLHQHLSRYDDLERALKFQPAIVPVPGARLIHNQHPEREGIPFWGENWQRLKEKYGLA